MSEKKTTNVTWGGRFQESTDAFVAEFTASVNFDCRLAYEDIQTSLAHVAMLGDCNILSIADITLISQGLQQIQEEIQQGTFVWKISLEDVHMNIENRLVELIGEAGKRLHTGRSRNDQVATDIRLHTRTAIDKIVCELKRLQEGILQLADTTSDMIMPGFTHLQIAQPVTFGHHLMAWYEMLSRDNARLADCRKRLNFLPLGAAALAGTILPY